MSKDQGPQKPPGSRIDVIRILLLVQGGIAVTTTLGVVILGAAVGGPLLGSALATGTSAVLFLWLARAVSHGSRRARRVAMWVESGVIFGFAVDLLLSLLLARRPLELVPVITQLVMPIAVIRLLRSSDVRVMFGLRPRKSGAVAEGSAA